MRFAEHFRQAKSEGGRVRGEIEWVKRVPRWIGVPVVRDPLDSFASHVIASSELSFSSQILLYSSICRSSHAVASSFGSYCSPC